MKHIEALFAVTPTAVLRLLLALLDVSPAFDRVRRAVAFDRVRRAVAFDRVRRAVAVELRFRAKVPGDLAYQVGASLWGIAPVGVA